MLAFFLDLWRLLASSASKDEDPSGDFGRFWSKNTAKITIFGAPTSPKRALFGEVGDFNLQMALLDLKTFCKNKKVTEEFFSSFRKISTGNTTEIST